MSRHKHADLIHAWAEGAEIQYLNDEDIWNDLADPTWGDEDAVFRIKPKVFEWYENIPEHGVLCWVSDINASLKVAIGIIISKHHGEYPSLFKATDATTWVYAKPLTDDEIKQFLRGE